MTTRWVLIATIALTLFRSTSWANDIFIEAYGDSIEMSLIQKNGQDNDIDLYVSGDYNSTTVTQDGNYNTANIIQSGPEPVTVDILQTGDNFSTTVNLYCTTPNGCSVTVTQY